jgi:hypothetical protein
MEPDTYAMGAHSHRNTTTHSFTEECVWVVGGPFQIILVHKFCPKADFSNNFDQIYRKKNIPTSTQPQISFIKSTMKEIYLLYLFGIVDANIFFINLLKTREVYLWRSSIVLANCNNCL